MTHYGVTNLCLRHSSCVSYWRKILFIIIVVLLIRKAGLSAHLVCWHWECINGILTSGLRKYMLKLLSLLAIIKLKNRARIVSLRVIICNVRCSGLMLRRVLGVSLCGKLLRLLIEVLVRMIIVIQASVARLMVKRLVGLVGGDVVERLELNIRGENILDWLLLLL